MVELRFSAEWFGSHLWVNDGELELQCRLVEFVAKELQDLVVEGAHVVFHDLVFEGDFYEVCFGELGLHVLHPACRGCMLVWKP